MRSLAVNKLARIIVKRYKKKLPIDQHIIKMEILLDETNEDGYASVYREVMNGEV